MNTQESDILKIMIEKKMTNQRLIAEESGHSLGVVNRSVKGLFEQGYIDEQGQPTSQAMTLYTDHTTRNAVILAAGFGMRMVPVNLSAPKGLLEVKGEHLIERQITQLHAAGINDITIVVGFMKEQFDYLIDKYGVELIYNPEYSSKNNLHSLKLAAERLGNTYIVPCDVWCREDPFNRHEMYSWYMISEEADPDSNVKVNRKREIVRSSGQTEGSRMVGITYLSAEDAPQVRERILQLASQPEYDGSYWEEALYQGRKMTIPARCVQAGDVVEINTYEQLRELDSDSDHLKSDAIEVIADVLHVDTNEIVNITVLKKGMTNRSFLFTVHDQKYIMRIPGEGTELLINRKDEAEVYQTISGLGLCDDPVYINPENGYKITKFLDNIRTADPENDDDLHRCMDRLRSFHQMQLKVDHDFDIFGHIDYYEKLRAERSLSSVYRDYKATKEHVLSLQSFIESLDRQYCLTHIDAVCDNFLFYEKDGREELQLTDWEYASMQDPHVDIAMFCIYSFYNKDQIDHLIDIYFEGRCDRQTRAKIYCYVSACGLLWSNWSEYKLTLGVEFGDYGLKQYRYAKDFYKYAMKEIEG